VPILESKSELEKGIDIVLGMSNNGKSNWLLSDNIQFVFRIRLIPARAGLKAAAVPRRRNVQTSTAILKLQTI
jgi:hypothetical protein